MIVKALLEAHTEILIPADAEVAKLPELNVTKIKLFKSITYPFGPPMNDYMETFLPNDHVVVVKYYSQFASKQSPAKKKRKDSKSSKVSETTEPPLKKHK